jgi:hypothetical protein
MVCRPPGVQCSISKVSILTPTNMRDSCTIVRPVDELLQPLHVQSMLLQASAQVINIGQQQSVHAPFSCSLNICLTIVDEYCLMRLNAKRVTHLCVHFRVRFS